MKKLSLILAFGFISATVVGCGSQVDSPILTADIQNAEISANKKNPEAEKPVTKTPVDIKSVKPLTTEFARIAASKGKNFYKPEIIKQAVKKNGPFDNYLPFRTYYDFQSEIRWNNTTDYNNFHGDRNGNFHFNKSISAYEYAQNIYKANSSEMKRFITVDVLANSLEVNGYEIAYSETHNPPYRPEFKVLPTRAAQIMPTFGEIYDYNRYSSGVPYVRWDLGRAASYYQANYARYMGLIMEHAPDKNRAYELVHREISSYAAN